jgi:type II secretory pathway pseudopilin PulG
VLLENVYNSKLIKEKSMQKFKSKNPVNHSVCETVDREEILNQLMAAPTHTGSVDSSLVASLCKVQNDSYVDLADCHLCKLDDMKKSFDRVQNGDEAVAANDKPSVETLTRISNFREAQIEILPSHRERGVFARLFPPLQGNEILNQLMAAPTHTGSVDSSLVASLCKVQNDTEPCGQVIDAPPSLSVRGKNFLVNCGELRNLGEGFSNVITNKGKKAAFTLAETLIAIGIIGVVSALTIPTLMSKYNEIVTVQRLKKAYSEMAQAIKLSEAENGEYKGWDWTLSASAFGEKYILPYLAKSYTKTNIGMVVHTMSDETFNWFPKYYYLDKTIAFTMTHSVRENAHDINYLSIYVDLNGDRGRNFSGLDIFVMSLFDFYGNHDTPNCKTGDFQGFHLGGAPALWASYCLPTVEDVFGVGTDNASRITGDCRYAKSNDGRGTSCALAIEKSGWKIPKNYPLKF